MKKLPNCLMLVAAGLRSSLTSAEVKVIRDYLMN